MFSKTDTSKVIVLSRSTVYRDEDSSVPIRLILTPQFYLLKKEELPIKYAYQAKRIAPSLFEEEYGGDTSVRFFVFKCQEAWCFIAYRPEEIAAFVQERGIDAKRIEKIYFAEQLAHAFQTPYAIDAQWALATVDDTVTVVPRKAVGEAAETLDSVEWPKTGVRLTGARGSVRRHEWAAMAVLCLFAVLWFIEGLRYQGGIDRLRAEQAKLTETYPQLQTRYTRESILRKYQTTDRAERTKRDVLQQLSRYVFRGVTLQEMALDANGYTLRVQVDGEASKRKLISLAKRNGLQTRIEADGIVLQGVLP